jgi:ATP synthase protein I
MGPVDTSGAQRAAWNATVGRTIALQWAVILLLAGVAWIGYGAGSAKSLLLGGVAVALPNALLALWLTARLYRAGTVGMTALFGGELLKLGMTIALLTIVVVALKPQVAWLALLVGVVAALKAQWLAVWFTRHS